MKRVLTILAAALLLGSLLSLPVWAETEEEPLVDFVVEVESGRSPRVLQISDPQIIDPSFLETNGEGNREKLMKDMEERCFQYIRQVVNNTKPDLILVAGDLVYGCYDKTGEGFQELVKFFDGFGIPWAPVYGNHDAEEEQGILWMNELLENAEHCLFKKGNLEMTNGNYTVGIRQNGKLTRVFFMMDSNGTQSPSKSSILQITPSEGFTEEQVEWLTEQGSAIKQAHPEVNFSFVFHIAFKAFGEAMGSVEAGELGLTAGEEENFGYLHAVGGADWDRDQRIYNAMKALGTDSILAGHTHTVSASVVYDGVRFQYGQKSSTYDCINYRLEDGTITQSYDPKTGEPIVGGTLMIMDEQTGDFVDFEIVLWKEEPVEKTDWMAWLMPLFGTVIPALMAGVIVLRNRKKE